MKRDASSPVVAGSIPWSIAIVALLLTWGIRLLVYAPEELGLDGHLSVGLALLPLPRLFEFLARDVHPPFFYLMLKAWLGLVGVNYVSARWLDVAAGTLTLALLYRFIASLAGPRGGLVAVALLIVSPAQLGASATVRDFGMGLMFSVASLVAWRALDEPVGGRRRQLSIATLAVTTALALATWYFHALFVLAQLAALAVNPRNWRGRLGALAAGVVVQTPWAIVAVGPLVAKVQQGVTVSGHGPSVPSLQAVLTTLGTSLAGGLPTPTGHLIAFAAWLILAGWGVAWADSEGDIRRAWAFVAFFGFSAGLLAVYGLASRWAGASLLGRYGLVLLPWAALGQAWAFGSVWAKPKGADADRSPAELNRATSERGAPVRSDGATSPRRARQRLARQRASDVNSPAASALATFVPLALATVVLVGQATDLISLEQLEGMPWSRQIGPVPELALIQGASQPTDLVVFTDLARAGQYALRGGGRAPSVTIHVAGSTFLRDDLGSAGAILAPLLVNRSRVWLLYDRPIDGASLTTIDGLLGRDRFLTREDTFGNAVVDQFEAAPSVNRETGPERFGGSIGLLDWAVSPTAAAGGTVFVDLRWQATAPVDADYTVFVHLVDGGGKNIAQHDGAPSFGNRPTTTWRPGEAVDDRVALAVPAATAPGTYRVMVGLYRGQARLPLASGGDALDAGSVVVTRP